jgi:AraC-like DNA-binding protein
VQQVLGIPGAETAGRITDLASIAPDLGPSLTDRLAECHRWDDRFDLVETALLARTGIAADPMVAWMWAQIVASGGRTRIAALVRETGWSHRHATTRFREQVGLGPKAVAGIVRFERALGDLAREPLASVAARHGYSDQSHLSREIVRYAGSTPQALRSVPPPTARGALGVGDVCAL